MESWKAVYVTVVLAGLMVGWLASAYMAVVFIWALIILLEVYSTRKKSRL